MLRDTGALCIRTSTRDLLDRVPYVSYFPAALAHNRRRLPSKEELIETVCNAGLSLVRHRVVEQVFAESFGAYVHKISQRGLSDLTALSDEDFETGLQHMVDDVPTMDACGPVLEPIDLFVFRKVSTERASQ